jgi:MtN3 and saliva related transmembrane protein
MTHSLCLEAGTGTVRQDCPAWEPRHPRLVHDVHAAGERTIQTWWLTALGLVAGLCTSLSFVPQVLKAWREGDTAAISKRMYVASLIAYGLWIVHGLMITSVPVILFNGVNVVFAGIILALKLRGLKATEAH